MPGITVLTIEPVLCEIECLLHCVAFCLFVVTSVNVINYIYFWLTGVAQGVITGIRSLCYGLGPALFGFVFYLFHVDVEKADIDPKPVARNVSQHRDDFSILQQINEVHICACSPSDLSACLF